MPEHDAARWVLQHFPAATAQGCEPLGNRGGFSGARLWKVQGFDSPLCLRAWPKNVGPERLQFIHSEMTRAASRGLDFVPKIHSTRSAVTWVQYAGRVWDLTTWMPGVADFASNPSETRIELACTALARLHNAWHEHGGPAVCPAILRRLERLQIWQEWQQSGWRPLPSAGLQNPIDDLVRRAWQVLPRFLERLPDRLRPWTTRSLPLQTCLCDIWHDHILFNGNKVGGIIDYGSLRSDHVAVDLARLLGSLVGDDTALLAAGLVAYLRVRPLSSEEEQLVRVLDETGTLIGIANWLIWLYHEHRHFEDPTAVAQRLGVLVTRIERWK
jgi:Ser/Thr protein kinase RdoA (MazF antagonist)